MKQILATCICLCVCIGVLLTGTADAQDANPSDILVADFEGHTYGDWKAEGDAFGTGPARQDATEVSVTAIGGNAKLRSLEAHELKSIWN